MAFEQQKETFAEQIARLIRLMPDYPGGIIFGMGEAQQTTAAVLYEQKKPTVALEEVLSREQKAEQL